MNVMQAGLPNQVDRSASSLSVIGSLILDTEHGLRFKRGDNEFARTGVVFPASQYPEAAKDSGLMVNGIPAVGHTSTNSALCGIADNGAGTIVAVFADSTNAYYSLNYGATWAAVAHNLGMPATDVVWHSGQSRFIIFGNTATAIGCSWSATGTSGWAAGTTSACTSATINTAKAACDGTICVVAVKSSTAAGCVATTTNGTVLTARTPAAAATINPYVAVLPSLGASRWLIVAGAATLKSTAADGSTWGAGTITGAVGYATGVAAGNGIFNVLMTSGSGMWCVSADGSTWTVNNLPDSANASVMDALAFPANAGDGQCNTIMFDGARFVSATKMSASFSVRSGVFGYTTDGLSWIPRQLTYQPGSSTNMFFSLYSVGGNLVIIPSGSGYAGADRSASYATSANWVASCDYVGKARPVSPMGAHVTSTAVLVCYVGVK